MRWRTSKRQIRQRRKQLFQSFFIALIALFVGIPFFMGAWMIYLVFHIFDELVLVDRNGEEWEDE